jgi:hypothetical protein
MASEASNFTIYNKLGPSFSIKVDGKQRTKRLVNVVMPKNIVKTPLINGSLAKDKCCWKENIQISLR